MSGYGNGGRDQDGGWDRFCEEQDEQRRRGGGCTCKGSGIRYVYNEDPANPGTVSAFCVCDEGLRQHALEMLRRSKS